MTADHPPPPSTRWTPRLAAAVTDLILVTTPIALALASTVERFTIVGILDEQARFSPTDQRRIDALADDLGRGVEWNGSLYGIGLGGVAIVALVAAVVALLVGVIVPTATGGRTPGKIVFGLKVVTEDGAATAAQHLLRTVAGPIDLLPWFVPGLVAVVVSGFDPNGRRLGDRLANTIVVPAALPRRRSMAMAAGPSPTDLILLDEPSQLDDDPHDPGDWPDHLSDSAGRPDHGLDIRDHSPTERPNRPDSASTIGPADRSGRSGRNSARWYPGREEAIDPAGGLHIVDQPVDDGAEIVEADGADTTGRDLLDPSAGGVIDLVFPESSLAESPLLALAQSELRRQQREIEGRELTNRSALRGSATSTDGNEPVWNQSLEAWLYCEPASGQWFRHDPKRDRWEVVVISDPLLNRR